MLIIFFNQSLQKIQECYENINEICCFKNGLCMLSIVLLFLGALYALFCLFLYRFQLFLSRWFIEGKQLKNVRKVALIVAHPDDECMFFGPILLKLTANRDCQVYLLCLSTGNQKGLGSVRKEELRNSCRILGVNSSNVMVVSHTRLPDDPSYRWDKRLVAKIILQHILAWDVDTIVTFGNYGVSGHANHKALYRAIRYLYSSKQLPAYCCAFALEDVSILRKYLGIFDVPFTYIFSRYVYVSTYSEVGRTKKAMESHSSQMVWFRKLYLIFSRYVIVNGLVDICDSTYGCDEDTDDDLDFLR